MPKNNLIFISGPPGAGKTTLSEHLCNEDARIDAPGAYSHSFDFTSLDPAHRNFSEIWRQATQDLEYFSSAAERPEYIVLGEKCIYDLRVYNDISFKNGWISKSDYESSFSHISDFFRGDLSAPYAIVLNPGYDVCKRHLEKKWKKECRKGNESDFSYLDLACNAYKNFSLQEYLFPELENVLYLDCEQDLSKEGLSGIISWIYDKYNFGVSKEKAVLPSANDIYDYVINGVVHRNDRDWLDALSSAPRYLDHLLEPDVRNRILHSFHCTGSVDPNDREHAIQLVLKCYDYHSSSPDVTRDDAIEMVDHVFGYYAALAEDYDPYAPKVLTQDKSAEVKHE